MQVYVSRERTLSTSPANGGSLKVPCAPKRFEFEFPVLKTTKLLSRDSLINMSNGKVTSLVAPLPMCVVPVWT